MSHATVYSEILFWFVVVLTLALECTEMPAPLSWRAHEA